MRPVALQSGKTRKPVHSVRGSRRTGYPMLDIVMLAFAFGFFVAGIGYAYACERL